jgi:hypothetical protein
LPRSMRQATLRRLSLWWCMCQLPQSPRSGLHHVHPCYWLPSACSSWHCQLAAAETGRFCGVWPCHGHL